MYQRLSIKDTPRILAITLSALAAVVLLLGLAGSASAQSTGTKPVPKSHVPMANQVIYGFPLTTTVEDSTQMDITYRSDTENQFFGGDAEGVYLWLNNGGTVTVYGPQHVPAGRTVNPYTFVSNTKSGAGTPSNPWVVTTVVDAPSPHVRLTQRAMYVNGAEFIGLNFSLQQIGGTAPITATLFHAADLYTAGSDSGYGYYDSTTGGVGDYFTRTDGTVLYQQFVPNSNTPATAYMESYYSTIWAAIGDTSGPGSGFDNTIISDTLHDSGAGLQWDLTVPQTGSVAVGDTDLFSPHASLCGSFSDVPYGSFYYDYVYYLACHGIVSGYSDTTFRPNASATRSQLSKMVVLAQGWPIDTSGGPHFIDVPITHPFYTYVETAYHHGVISGYSDQTFHPYSNVTRGQTTKIIVNARGWAINTTGGPHFMDVQPGSAFYNYVETAFNRNIISGYSDNTFRPNNDVTRGQISKILYLALQSTAR